MKTDAELRKDVIAEPLSEPTVSAQLTALKDAVEKAVKRDADVDAEHIEVSAEGDDVTLTGTVPTSHDRDAAGSAACGVPGVRSVENDLAVSSCC